VNVSRKLCDAGWLGILRKEISYNVQSPTDTNTNKDTNMKRGNAFPSKYLSRTDVESPILCTVGSVMGEDIKSDHGDEHKPVCYFTDQETGLVVNGVNWDMIEKIARDTGVENAEDSDNWANTKVVLYFDPTIRFGNKVTGGIRVRAPRVITNGPTPPAPAPDPEPPALTDDQVPF
jgi:hypothetical protein